MTFNGRIDLVDCVQVFLERMYSPSCAPHRQVEVQELPTLISLFLHIFPKKENANPEYDIWNFPPSTTRYRYKRRDI